jgi:hypothetical protein
MSTYRQIFLEEYFSRAGPRPKYVKFFPSAYCISSISDYNYIMVIKL